MSTVLSRSLKKPNSTASTTPTGSMSMSTKKDTTTCVSEMVSELMNARTSIHKLHLKVTGVGSYAGHKALNELYDALPDHADDLAEGYQGAAELLLSYSDLAPKTLNTVDEAIAYLNTIKKSITDLQTELPYSEIINELDNVKSTINSIKYKLLFLK